MQLPPVVIGAIIGASIAVAGSIVNSFFAWRISVSKDRAEEQKHIYGLLFNAALENWKTDRAEAKDMKGSVGVPPFDTYLLHMIKLWEVCKKKDTNSDNVAARLAAVQNFSKAVTTQAEEYTKSL